MTIKEFEEKQKELLRDPEIAAAWNEYQAQFPHVSEYFRRHADYANQISIVNGKKAGTDINLYKLFTERCFHLLKDGGRCGIVIPSGIYTDLGAKQLREMLFASGQVTSLFGVSNEKFIFEGVHHSFKICILTFRKGGTTRRFPAAFRINPREAVSSERLDQLFRDKSEQVEIDAALMRRLSPDSLSVMEFKSEKDIEIAEKMLRFPFLGQKFDEKWNLVIRREFDMTMDSYLFKTNPGDKSKSRLPLYEGKMIHQFRHDWGKPKYWVDEEEAREALTKRDGDDGRRLDYQSYRLAYREIARDTDERSMICCILPQNVYANHKLHLSSRRLSKLDDQEMLFVCAVFNSMTLDSLVRQRINTSITMAMLYQLPVPRLTARDAAFAPIVERAARLICTTPEFDALWQAVFPRRPREGATDFAERARLRAELDAMVAHLYGLTEDEFAHILRTFPLVSDPVKLAARNAYRDIERGVLKV